MFKRVLFSLLAIVIILSLNIVAYAASDSDFISANAGQGTKGDVYTAGTWNTSRQGYRVTVVDSTTGGLAKPVKDFVFSDDSRNANTPN